MIVALTGGTGFLGGFVVARLIDAGHSVRALTRRVQPPTAGVTWVEGSLEDKTSLAALCGDTDAVVHVAGVTNAPDAGAFDRGNRGGTIALLDATEAAGVERFVHVSSLAAREPGLSAYGASKRAGEDAVTASSRDWRIVRPPAVYGPGDTDNFELFRLARRGIVPLPPRGRLSLIHADDLARLIVSLVQGRRARTFYEADDGHAHGWSHRDYAAMIGDAVERSPLVVPLPKAVLAIGARVDRLFRGEKAKLTPDRVSYMVHPDWVIDPSKRPPVDLWTPCIATADGLRATADWYRAAGWL